VEHVLICKSCKKKFDIGNFVDLLLQNHIITHKPIFFIFMMLYKIEEHLIAPHLTFTQIFQLHGYGQYGVHGNIVNVPMNLNIIHIVLPCYYYYSFSFFFPFFIL
jgi:hypothetical protein